MPPLSQPRLIVFRGLPGTGKTTIARELAKKLGAFHLRIDTVEQAIKATGIEEIGPAGYAVAHALAEDNLKLGFSVIADCVNPVAASRRAWREVAVRSSALLMEISLLCSDKTEHRRRVEERQPDIAGHRLPDWEAVLRHEVEPPGDAPPTRAGHRYPVTRRVGQPSGGLCARTRDSWVSGQRGLMK